MSKKNKKMADFDLAIEGAEMEAPIETPIESNSEYLTEVKIPVGMVVARIPASSKAIVSYNTPEPFLAAGFELVAPEDIANLDNSAYVMAKITGSGGCATCGK